MSFVRYVFSALEAGRTRNSNSYLYAPFTYVLFTRTCLFCTNEVYCVRRFKDEISRPV